MSDVHDPFEVLRADLAPVEPEPGFARDLRARLVAELAGAAAAPRGAVSVTPYLVVHGAAAAIDFYVAAFGAVEHHRLVGDDGRIGHAEILIGATRVQLADEYPEAGIVGPAALGGTPVHFTIEVGDVAAVDATVARAVELGATVVRPVGDQFHGNRQGRVRDPFGHEWAISAPLPGFDEARYVANSAEIGFRHRRGPRRG